MTKTDILNSVNQIWSEAIKMFSLTNTKVPTVEFFEKGSTAGWAFYAEHKVKYNSILAKENPGEFITTIAHELAHLITHQIFPNAKQQHGPEFRSVMKALGYDGSTCHSYDTSSVSVKRAKKRFEYVCKACGHVHQIASPTHSKMVNEAKTIGKVASWTCGKCRGEIVFSGKETIIY